MAYLNQQEREQLLNELKNMSFNRAKGKVRGMDSKVKLGFYRNNQETGRWLTRYDLPTLGTRVTLVEANNTKSKGSRLRADFDLIEVIVEPTPDNRT